MMMMPTAAHHGSTASRISPRTIPAMPTLVLGVMMTPSVRAHRPALPVAPILPGNPVGSRADPAVLRRGQRAAAWRRSHAAIRDDARLLGRAGTVFPSLFAEWFLVWLEGGRARALGEQEGA